MHPAIAHDLAFLAPGLVHQFGNLLLTIQGHSLHLAPEAGAVSRAKTVILNACDRGAGSLRILRHLLGGSAPEQAHSHDALALLVELLRIPVREAGHTLDDVTADDGDGQLVSLDAFVPLTVALVRILVGGVPHGVRGEVRLALAPGAALALVATFRPAAGSLPFPLATEAALRQLRAETARRGWPHRLESTPDGLVAHLPGVLGVMEA